MKSIIVTGIVCAAFCSFTAKASTAITEADYGGDFAGEYTNPSISTDIGVIGIGSTTISGLNDDFVDAVHFSVTGNITSMRYIVGNGNAVGNFGISFGHGTSAVLAGFADPNNVLIDNLIIDNPYDQTFTKALTPGDYFLTWHDSGDPIAYSVIIETSPVPEANTYAMMLAGLGLVGFMAKRRKQVEA